MADRSHLSIGEVLSLLQDEFPDVTISKIRFLESQGLIDPERTPSGYRKFYETDIDKLRWVLRQQRENFLPLKVIKDRLDEHGGKIPPDDPGADAAPNPPTAPAAPVDARLAPATAPEVATTGSLPFAPNEPATAGAASSDQPVWMQDHARQTAARGGSPTSSTPPVTGTPSAQAQGPLSAPLGADMTTVNLTEDELLRASALTAAQLRSLEQYGLVKGRQIGPDVLYDGETVLVAQKASAFLARGIEARHLRMFKVAAERESGFLEQVVTPLLKQRNPGARQQAVELLQTLIELGDGLHAALLRHALHDYLHPPG